VGDKISLILAPVVASLGFNVPMMAGRGLGHTGGTIDKLEAIPGFRCDLSVQEFQDICNSTGAVIAAASGDLCPADKKLYALRDVTATVSSLPLQTASIMSKKIAENPDSLVLGKSLGSRVICYHILSVQEVICYHIKLDSLTFALLTNRRQVRPWFFSTRH